MNPTLKKILFVVGFIIITALLGYAIYTWFLREEPAPAPSNNTNEEFGGGLPTAGVNQAPNYLNVNGQLVPADNVDTTAPSTVDSFARGGVTKVTAISTNPVQGLHLASDGKTVVGYDPTSGKFLHYKNDGTTTELTDKTFPNVKEITWAPNGEKAVLTFPDNTNIVYNFKTKKQVSFPSHWTEFEFSADSNRLAFKNMQLDRENRWLTITNDDGSAGKTVAPIGDNSENISVMWSPDNRVVGNYRESIDFDRQYLIFIGQNQENLPSTIIEGRGFDGRYSPDGTNLLYSVYSSFTDMKPNLWFVTASGEQTGLLRVNLELNTWVDKCAFSNATTAYCAVPQSLPKGAGLVRDVATNTPDNFYRVDLQSGAKTLVAVPDGTYTAENVTISADGKTLYFTDRATGTAQQLRLK